MDSNEGAWQSFDFGETSILDELLPEEGFPEASIDQNFTNLKVGDIIRMGYYEQDSDPNNLREPIEWKVISVNKKKNVALVASVYALDSVTYGTEGKEEEYTEPGLNWENAAIRQWLNDEIYEKCFTSAEKDRIRQVTNITQDPSGRVKTNDYVFLLSRTETVRYFKSVQGLKCEPTPYALSKLSSDSSAITKDGSCRWWIRELTHAVKVNRRGEAVGVDHNEAGYVDGGKGMATFLRKIGALTYEEDAALVRPAMWIRYDAPGK